MTMPRAAALVFLVCGLVIVVLAQDAGSRTHAIDRDRSTATIAVGKSGVFSFAAGHTHEVAAPAMTGSVIVDGAEPSRSTVRVMIDASALRVTGNGESPDDVPKVQQTMAGDQVLDVRRYPTIAFKSTNISVKNRSGATMDLVVAGQLTLHNVTRSVSVPVTARFGTNELTATGRFPLKQTDYGIKPVSVGGVVSVKDTVEITFTIVGR